MSGSLAEARSADEPASAPFGPPLIRRLMSETAMVILSAQGETELPRAGPQGGIRGTAGCSALTGGRPSVVDDGLLVGARGHRDAFRAARTVTSE